MTKSLRLARDILRAEGAAAFADRSLDRLASWRRRRSFRRVAEVAVETPVLNVLPTAPRPDFGGVQVQLLRRLEAEAELRPWALLYPDAGGYRLEACDGRRREAMAFDEPFERAVPRAARAVGARGVHFEQLVGLPLESVAGLGRDGYVLVISVHDFGLFCLRPHLVERPQLRFCGYCREPRRCARCLSHDWEVEEGFQEVRRAAARDLLASAGAVVYPSDFLRRRYAELMPGLEEARQHVVEPPSEARPARTPPIAPRPRVRHLAYVGSVAPHKGALVLEEILRRRAGAGLRWTVYGGGDRDILLRLRRLPGVRVRGYYRAGALPRMLRDDRVDLALLPSIWPESYALTLDECRLAGVPVLAFDHGAIADRLRRSPAGETVDPQGGAAAMLDALDRIVERGVRATQADAGERELELPDARAAAAATAEIYRRLGLDKD